jgi:hypothetical protein
MSFSITMPNKGQALSVHMTQALSLGVFLTGLSYAVGLLLNWTDGRNLL